MYASQSWIQRLISNKSVQHFLQLISCFVRRTFQNRFAALEFADPTRFRLVVRDFPKRSQGADLRDQSCVH